MTNHQYADISQYDTFPKLLAYNASHFPKEIALREKEFGIWNEITWREYNSNVRLIALGLHDLGLQPEEALGIIGENRPEWVQFEIAAHALRARSLGIYQDSLNQEVAYLINYADVRILMAEDEEQVDKLLEISEECPCIQHIIYHDPRGMRKYDDPRLVSQEDLMARGAELDKRQPDLYDTLVAGGSGTDIAILCTTSGTTSNPKMAMLESGKFLHHCAAYLQADHKRPGDNYVSILPLPWIMEQVYVLAQALIARITVNFVEEQETMMSDLREIGPHFALLAPRVLESIAADVKARMMDATPFKQRMFRWGMKLGMEALESGKRSKLAEWLLFRALKDRLGFTFLRSAATGGAALGPDTFKFFLAMGIPLKQLYGQTELGGSYTIHRHDDIDYESVGVPFENAELYIKDPDEQGIGEIVARTTGMFSGYYKNEKATKEDVRDGWMYTGDAGYIKESNGHLVVIDRIKDMATTSTGYRFSPMYIENKLKFSPFVAEAVILGNERPYLAAMICIRFSIVSKWAEQRAISFTNYTNLSSRPEVYKAMREEIDRVNDSLPEQQKIKRFVLLYKELDADDGELTRTRKVRRNVISEKYGDIIDAIYSGDDSVHVDTEITFQDGTKSKVITDLQVMNLTGAELPVVDKNNSHAA